MEEIHCPMCGKPNLGGAEECVHCGARLKPLEVGGSPEDSEDWLDRMREEAAEPPTDKDSGEVAPSEPESEPDFDRLKADEELPGRAEEKVPEWLQRIRAKQAEEPKGLPASGEAAPEEALRAAATQAGDLQEGQTEKAPLEDLRPVDEPEDLRAAATQADEVQEEQTDPAPEGDLGPVSEPDPAAESPDWLEGTEDQGAEDLPHVPALVGGADESPDLELGDLGLPDWLGEIEPLEDEQPPRAAPDLAPATLPNWLEAMRPVETFRSVVEIESEDDQAVESVGPLAGLSGVLLAEPVVAMPRTSSVGSMQLDVSERQYAQAELLHRLVDEEEREAPAAPMRKTRLAVFRWVIAAFLLVAVALPIFTDDPTFSLPGFESKELRALFNMVEKLPVEKPALVVFDYEPGNSGELEAVSGPLLDQMMAKGLKLASMSTRPTGSSLAVRAVERHGYKNGQNIVHMGYLSGGPIAVQLFAVNPREAVLKGFALPEEVKEAGLTAWDTPVLDQVQALSDFGMVVVITANSESARVWAEQAGPNLGETPLIMVLSAPAEPLIRPYFESADPQVAGILSGLRSAVIYEGRNGRFGQARERWDAAGNAILAAEIVLLAGIGYGIVIWWRSRR